MTKKRWSAIAILSGLFVFLWWFILAVKRFHDATVAVIYEAQKEIAKEYAARAKTIELLTLFKGRYDASIPCSTIVAGKTARDRPYQNQRFNTKRPIFVTSFKIVLVQITQTYTSVDWARYQIRFKDRRIE